jgi:hypothetical protein
MTDVARVSRVLVGVDFDEPSAAAPKMAGSLAAAWGAELTVLHEPSRAVRTFFWNR